MYQLIKKKNTLHQIIDQRHKVKNGKKTLIFSIKKKRKEKKKANYSIEWGSSQIISCGWRILRRINGCPRLLDLVAELQDQGTHLNDECVDDNEFDDEVDEVSVSPIDEVNKLVVEGDSVHTIDMIGAISTTYIINQFLNSFFVIWDTSICKIYAVKFVISQTSIFLP